MNPFIKLISHSSDQAIHLRTELISSVVEKQDHCVVYCVGKYAPFEVKQSVDEVLKMLESRTSAVKLDGVEVGKAVSASVKKIVAKDKE